MNLPEDVANDPYRPPLSMSHAIDSVDGAKRAVGIGRLFFFLAIIVASMFEPLLALVHIDMIGLLLGFVMLVVAYGKRLENIGYKGRWFLWIFVPFFNVFAMVICLVLPPNFARVKTLDTAGKIMATIVLLLVGLAVFDLTTEGWLDG